VAGTNGRWCDDAPDPTIAGMRLFGALAVILIVAGCTGAAAGVATGSPPTSTTGVPATPATPLPMPSGTATFAPPPSPAPGTARLEPPEGGAWFGLNLDWGSETAAEASASLGRTPAVWVQFAPFPLDDAARANLDLFVDQVAEVGGMAVLTLEPHEGLDTVTDAAASELADLLAGYWTDHGVATFVRFAHEMNGSWYPWSQDPVGYVAAFRRVADALHAQAPAAAMLWAPNQGGGYPFTGGAFEAPAGSAAATALDTNGDGDVSATDDPYAPYYPGDDAVDWVGMSLYHWGLAYPWGENELPRAGSFAAMLRGEDVGAHGMAAGVPDFYATYAEGHDKPLAIVETGILFDPAATGGPTGAELKTAWFGEVFGSSTRDDFPRIGMLNWFEWRKDEPEVGRTIDWRLGADPQLAAELLGGAAGGWLRFADD
jgi:hypothetical protein